MEQAVATWGTLVATIATAIATFFLWRVTKLLAVETKRMADAAAQPMVVASIIPNQWSMMHLDLCIANTGNATAFEVEMQFDPPLARKPLRPRGGIVEHLPFQRVSLLKPAQELKSYLAEFGQLKNQCFCVEIKWKNHPNSTNKETLRYEFDMADYQHIGSLGAENPAVQIAEQIKKLREDWKSIANGHRRIQVDNFSEQDRRDQQEKVEHWLSEIKSEDDPSAVTAPTKPSKEGREVPRADT